MSDNQTGKRIEFAARALKMPAIRRCWAELAERARTDNWTHEQYLAAILDRQVSEREANGTMLRISGARFPAVKTLEDFNFDHLPGLRRDVIAHLATSTWIAKSDNVILLGPPGVGKTHLAIALGIKAAHNAYPVLFDTATGWATRLTEAHTTGRLAAELKRLRRYRDRLPPIRLRHRQPVLPTHCQSLRTRLDSDHLEHAIRPLGRSLRRRRRRRRTHRPPRPSRRGHRYRRRLLPHQSPTRTRQHRPVTTPKGVKIQPSIRGQFSAAVDTVDIGEMR